MASHPLDNPVWNALTGPQASLAAVSGRFRRYRESVALFAAVEVPAEGFEGLEQDVPAGTVLGLVAPHPVALPAGMDLIEVASVQQMVAATLQPGGPLVPIRELAAADVPAMLELTALTHPGPFFSRTIEMGRYVGIFEGNHLVAMAGERMHLAGFVEISAVCTHPAYQGRGYAKSLVSVVARDILARGETPFLHVRDNNAIAVATYEKLGFVPRQMMSFTVVRRR